MSQDESTPLSGQPAVGLPAVPAPFAPQPQLQHTDTIPIPPAASLVAIMVPASGGEPIDDRHHRYVHDVECRNTHRNMRRRAALRISQLTRAINRLRARKKDLDPPERHDSLRETGLTHRSASFLRISHGIALGDAWTWFLAAGRALVGLANWWLLVACILIAYAMRWIGTHVADALFVDPTSEEITVNQLLRARRITWIVVVTFVVLVLFSFFLPTQAMPAFMALNFLLFLPLNLSLAFLSGIYAALGNHLALPGQYDHLCREIRQKETVIAYLSKYLTVLFVLVAFMNVSYATDSACAGLIDMTASGNPTDRRDAVTFVRNTIFDYVEAKNCSMLVIVPFTGDGRFTRRSWIVPPRRPHETDCSLAEPAPLDGHLALYAGVRAVRDARKAEAVHACVEDQEVRRAKYTAAQRAFLALFDRAITASVTHDWSRISEMVQDILTDGRFTHVFVITDGVDNPVVDPSGLRVPPNTSVTLIVLRGELPYVTRERQSGALRAWQHVPRVTVATVGELDPSFWTHERRTTP